MSKINTLFKKWYFWLIIVILFGSLLPNQKPTEEYSEAQEIVESEFSTTDDEENYLTLNNSTENNSSQEEVTDPILIEEENEDEEQKTESAEEKTENPIIESYKVTNVVDGDTIKINLNGKIETIRIIGINTPETVDPRKPVECFGREASDKTKSLLEGKMVQIEIDKSQGDRDIYGRLLRYVTLPDGKDFGLEMISGGYAYEYTYRAPYAKQSIYKSTQIKAKENNKGLWSPDNCNENQSNINIEGKYYTSSHHTAKYYYPPECNTWEGLSPTYLKSFDTLEELLNQYSRTLSPQC